MYGAEKDWPRLIQVITKLAEVVTEPKHKAKYLHTASMIASRELSDLKLASKLLGQALEHDPDRAPAIDEALAMHQRLKNYDGVKNVLKLRIASAQRAGDNEQLLQSLAELADVYERFLGRRDQAVAVYESALEVDPGNLRFQEKLAKLYARIQRISRKPSRRWARGLERDPYQTTPYKMLRKVYTDARQADAAWCTCQALHVLGQAEPDEERFFDRMRSDEPAEVSDPASPDEWLLAAMPESSEPFLTELFALIQPFVVAARARPLASFQLTGDHQIDVERYPYGVVYAVNAGARTLSVPEPRVYQNPELASGGVVHRDVAAGAAARRPCIHRRRDAGRRCVPGGPVLGLLLTGPVRAPTAAQHDRAQGLAVCRDSLGQAQVSRGSRPRSTPCSKRIARSASSEPVGAWINSPTWSASCCKTARRSISSAGCKTSILAADAIGFVLSNDLEVASFERIRALPQDAGAPAIATRVERLISYAVSARYLTVREHLGLRLDGG